MWEARCWHRELGDSEAVLLRHGRKLERFAYKIRRFEGWRLQCSVPSASAESKAKVGMMSLRILWLLIGAVAVAACSSDEAEPGATSGGGDCGSYCSVRQSKGCAGEPSASECTQQCEDTYAPARETCSQEISAWLSCYAGALPDRCDDWGIDEDSAETQATCQDSYTAFQACAACLPKSGDSSCASCVKAQCCAERTAVFSDSEYLDYDHCTMTCMGAECDTCATQFPSAAAKFAATETCSATNCQAECGG